MIIQLKMSGDEPLYVQLRNQIVIGIGTGEVSLGEPLPTVRQMAQDTGINVMTVNKAYNILKNEGYIEIDRRHGAKVSPTVDLSGQFQTKMEEELKLLITESTLKGVPKEHFLEMCNALYEQLNIQTYSEVTV